MSAALTIVAQLMPYGHHGWGDNDGWWGFGMFFFMFLWVAVVALIAWAVLTRSSPSAPPPGHRAREILAERYARGELTTDEYHERLETLR